MVLALSLYLLAAARPALAQGTVSQYRSYTVDGTGWTQVSAADVKPEPYAPGLAWYKIAVANLNPGPHTLTLRVDGRRTQDDRHYFAIDAIVISPRGFKPNGIVKPF